MSLLREPGALAPYQQIRKILRTEILEKMAAGEQIAPERDLAKRFGANRGTVGRAIASLVSEGLLVRHVGRGTFVASGDNSQLRPKTCSVGLLTPYMHEAFPAGIIRSAVRQLRHRGYKAVLFDSEDSIAAEASELERFLGEGLDGVFVMPVEVIENQPLFKRLVRLGHPLVFLDRKPHDVEADYVATDHFWGAYEATSRLIRRGHTRIAHFTTLGPRNSSSVKERRMGYEQALIDNGIQVDPELVCPPALYAEERFAYKHSLAYLYHATPPVTAVFAMSNIFALATLAACQELRLKVPEDIELAAFFDGESGTLTAAPMLKVVQRQEEIGRYAVDLIMSRIEDGDLQEARTVVVRPDIVDDREADQGD